MNTGAMDEFKSLNEIPYPAKEPVKPVQRRPVYNPHTIEKGTTTEWKPIDLNAAKMVMAAADAGSLNHGDALTLLTMLGDLDDAFVQAQLYRPVNPYMPPYLFLPPTAPLRSDPRFMQVAAKLGLVDYWRSTGQWPDFCSEPGLPYDCRSEAAKIAALRPISKPMIGASP